MGGLDPLRQDALTVTLNILATITLLLLMKDEACDSLTGNTP